VSSSVPRFRPFNNGPVSTLSVSYATLSIVGLQLTHFPVYYGTTFFQQVGITNPFIITIATAVVNVGSTPLSFYTIEKFGRRPILIIGGIIMCFCEFIIAIVGTADSSSKAANKTLVAFVCIYVAAFACTWGPAAWVVIGELFPLPIRSKGVALSTASNWLWNCVIGVVTPYIVDPDKGNLGAKVFFIWGAMLFFCTAFAYFMVPETKGLSLEQVDRMLEETTPRTSAKWKPHTTYAQEMGLTEKALNLQHHDHNEGTTVEPAKVEV